MTTGFGIPSRGHILGIFGHHCNPSSILPRLYARNIVLTQKMTTSSNFQKEKLPDLNLSLDIFNCQKLVFKELFIKSSR